MGKKKNFVFTGHYGEVDTIKSIDTELFLWDVYGGGVPVFNKFPTQYGIEQPAYPSYPIYNPKFGARIPEYGIEQPAYPVQPIYATPTPEPSPAPTNPKFYYPMPEYPIEQPAYPVQPIFATPTPEPAPAPTNPKFYYPMPEYPIEQPAYPVQPIYATPTPESAPNYPMPKSGIDFGTPRAYEVPEVPKFDVEPPTLYTPLPDYPIEQPAYPVQPIYATPTPDTPIKTVEPYSPVDDFIQPVKDVPPFADDVEIGGGVVKPDVEPVKPDDFVDTKVSAPTSTETKLPETKPVSKNLTPYVYAGLGIVVILLVARMVTKKD